MKKSFWLVMALAFDGLICMAQTNSPPANLHHFFLPPVQLWQPAAAEQEQTPALSLVPVLEPSPGTGSQAMSLNNMTTDSDFQSRVIRPGEFYLTRHEQPSENRFVRAAETIWRPEVVHIGKTSVSCPVITAVKRKNLLCLINPIFFQASW